MKTDKIFSETIDYIMLGIEKIMNKSVQVGIFNEALANTGGGLLGAIFASLFYFLFEAQGTKIVIPILIPVKEPGPLTTIILSISCAVNFSWSNKLTMFGSASSDKLCPNSFFTSQISFLSETIPAYR